MQEKPQPRYATSEEYLAAKQSEAITEVEKLFHEQEDLIATLQATNRAMLRRIETLNNQLAESEELNKTLRDEMEGVGPPPAATQWRELLADRNTLKQQLAESEAARQENGYMALALQTDVANVEEKLEESAKERQVAWATYADEHGRVRQLEGVVREIVREWDERGDGRVTRAVEDKARALIDSARDD